MDKEVKQESSIPVQARVSIVSLAELTNYWEHEGYVMRSMSQLVAWSVDLLCEIMRRNEAIPVKIESVSDAHRHMEQRGLYQGSLKKRAFKKVGAAIRFETLRAEGVDPKSYTPIDYNILHNKRSVEPSPFLDSSLSDEELRKIAEAKLQEVRLKKQMEMHLLRKQTEEAIRAKKDGGELARDEFESRGKESDEEPDVREGMSEEEFYRKAKERDEDVVRRENAPIDAEWLRKNVVKP